MAEAGRTDDRPFFPTRVGHAGLGEHLFLGLQVYRDLLLRSTPAGLIALSILGRPLDDRAVRLAHRMAEVFTIADPRVPPLFVTRIVAGEGRPTTGVACGLMACANGRIGSGIAGAVAQMLLDLHNDLPSDRSGPQLADWLMQRRDSGKAMPGLGIPFRTRDDRVDAINRAMESEGHDGVYWKTCLALQAVSEPAIGLPPNITLCYGALCLDMGFEPAGAELFANMVGLHCFTANAAEAERQRDEVVRRLPPEHVDYCGTGPRRSPRRLAAEG